MQANRQLSILSSRAGASARMRACVARSHPTLPRAALSPWQPRLGSGARAGWARTGGISAGRDRAGDGRDSGSQGSFGSSLSSGDWFGPEGLASSHGFAESKRWAQRPAQRVGGARGPGDRGRGRAWDPPDPIRPDLTEPERPQGAVAAPGTLADLCPAFGSVRVLRGGNREPHPGPRRPLRALGPFLPAARGVLRGWVPPGLE